MKKWLSLSLCAVMLLLCVMGCTTDPNDPWSDAVYTEDTTLGTGAKAVEVQVQVNEHRVTFTIHTDAAMLGEALLAHEIVAGEEGEFGLYVKKVNGILADYDSNGAYWGFYQNGDYMMTGVDTTPIEGGEHYELVYTTE